MAYVIHITHLVIRIQDKSIANRVNLSHLSKACARVGLRMLKANREKRKINTNDGLITTAGKKFVWVWHLYVIPMAGPILGFNWPRKLLLEIDDIMRAIDYIIRESLELGGKDKALVVHYDPKGCKDYNMKVGSTLISCGFNVRMCSCAFDKQEYDRRKIRRTETQNINIRTALSAPLLPSHVNVSSTAFAFSTRRARSAPPLTISPTRGTPPPTKRRPSASSNANSSPQQNKTHLVIRFTGRPSRGRIKEAGGARHDVLPPCSPRAKSWACRLPR
eukprot:scaffold17139_cov123-Isochrysis_galbana.AAC.7